jgi:hypothetical protein
MSRPVCSSVVVLFLVIIQLCAWPSARVDARGQGDPTLAAWLGRVKGEATEKLAACQRGESAARQAQASNQRVLDGAVQANDQEAAAIARTGIGLANAALAKWRIAIDQTQGCLKAIDRAARALAQPQTGADGRQRVRQQVDSIGAGCQGLPGVEPASRPGIDQMVVPPPHLTASEIARKTGALRRDQARQLLTARLQGTQAQDALRDAVRARQQGDTSLAELRAKAALEQARTTATEDVRKELAQQEQLRALVRDPARRNFDDPLVRQALQDADAFLRSVEVEADSRLRQGLVLPEDRDLDLLFGTLSPRVWPGPKNPDAPLPNPLVEEAKRQKVVQLIIWERRENERLLAVFNDPTFEDDMVKDLLKRLK